MSTFNGFTKETIQFFNELKENNNKEWFDAHKSIYEKEVTTPLKALVTTLSPAMHNIDADFELRPHRAMSRIYRDIRFSKNKEPYKNCMWITFQVPVARDEWQNYPGYFLELSGDSYTLGMGLAMAKKKVMEDFKDYVKYDAAQFQQITQKTVLDRGFAVCGEDYKRTQINDLSEYYQPWLQKKSVWVCKTKPIGEEVFLSLIAEQIQEDFIALEWLYKFMKECQP